MNMKRRSNNTATIIIGLIFVLSILLLQIEELNQGLSALILAIIMAMSLLIFGVFIAYDIGKEGEEILNNAGWKRLPLSKKILITVILIIILGAISIIPKMHGYNRFPSIFVEFLVFAIFVRIVEVYIKKSLKKKSK